MKSLFVLLLLTCCGFSQSGCAQTQSETKEKQLGACEDCDLMFVGMPKQMNWSATIAGKEEPGEPLLISGVLYKIDGKTPAPGVILYVYHTDNKGVYPPVPNQNRIRHGRLRGWMKTDDQGRYEFKTIRPASYPNSNNPQHIHAIVDEPGKGYYWIEDYLFADDPLLPPKDRTRSSNPGGNGVITIKKNEQGVWVGKRDIVLGKNVSNY